MSASDCNTNLTPNEMNNGDEDLCKIKRLKSREYMRNYMREKYHGNPLAASQYRKSCRVKAKYGEEEWKKYGIYLGDVTKLKELIRRLPKEHVLSIVNEMNIDNN